MCQEGERECFQAGLESIKVLAMLTVGEELRGALNFNQLAKLILLHKVPQLQLRDLGAYFDVHPLH